MKIKDVDIRNMNVFHSFHLPGIKVNPPDQQLTVSSEEI